MKEIKNMKKDEEKGENHSQMDDDYDDDQLSFSLCAFSLHPIRSCSNISSLLTVHP